ncbi:MAG: WG repeat-containing protein [Bacteroidales bacterium]|jgi:hypothetical protein|nr:WG repeat-containing protein [Bacteroidales bacterium]
MKKFAFIVALFSFIGVCSAQTEYDKIDDFGVYKNDWALVSIGGKLGFINDKGKEVVPPIYDKIGDFGEYKNNLALVEINDKQGFINDKGEFLSK